MDTRSFFICNICNNFLNNPYYLPCHCLVCKHHLYRKSSIECIKCSKKFSLPHDDVKENAQLKNLIESGFYFTEEEKKLKQSLNKSVTLLQELYKEFQEKDNEFDKLHKVHFDKLGEEIKIRHMQLVSQADEIKNELLEKLNESRKLYLSSKVLNRPYSADNDFDLILERFKTPNLQIRNAETVYAELEQNFDLLKSRIKCINEWKSGLNNYNLSEFKCEKRFLKQFIGFLKHKEIKLENSDGHVSTSVSNTMPIVTPMVSNSLKTSSQKSPEKETIKLVVANNPFQDVESVDIKPVFAPIQKRRFTKYQPFTFQQREVLLSFFNKTNTKPDIKQREELATQINSSHTKVCMWFANERSKRSKVKYTSINNNNIKPKLKKTAEQIQILENSFKLRTRPSLTTIKKIAKQTKLPEKTVQQWFINQRAKGRNEIVLD